MLNLDEFVKRLELVMDFYGLSGGAFADKIGIQRSSLSHLLSGRNKPSLEFVMKIVSVLPDVDMDWILNGKGAFPKSTKEVAPFLDQTKQIVTPSLQFPDDIEDNISNKIIEAKEIEVVAAPEKHAEQVKEVEKPLVTIENIVIFYSDGTFTDYIKSNKKIQ